ncbi:hypothetical protein EJ08DRAFT_646541, partial [Tothia fuscella]
MQTSNISKAAMENISETRSTATLGREVAREFDVHETIGESGNILSATPDSATPTKSKRNDSLDVSDLSDSTNAETTTAQAIPVVSTENRDLSSRKAADVQFGRDDLFADDLPLPSPRQQRHAGHNPPDAPSLHVHFSTNTKGPPRPEVSVYARRYQRIIALSSLTNEEELTNKEYHHSRRANAMSSAEFENLVSALLNAGANGKEESLRPLQQIRF